MSDHGRPQYPDIDAWGMTHRGKVRPDNQDHFFLGSLARGVKVEQASVTEAEEPEVFSRLLHDAALAVHESLLKKAEREGGERRFATTLTLFLGLWPHAYLLQLGDSRCYVCRDGKLTQISRDQTLAQDLVDREL